MLTTTDQGSLVQIRGSDADNCLELLAVIRPFPSGKVVTIKIKYMHIDQNLHVTVV